MAYHSIAEKCNAVMEDGRKGKERARTWARGQSPWTTARILSTASDFTLAIQRKEKKRRN